jgi:hypothetical protein
VEGRTTVELLNPSFESLAEKGVVKIYADLEPRFPVPDVAGVVRQRVRLWHPYARTVHVERVRRLILTRDAPPASPQEVKVAIADIHPGDTVDAPALALDLEPGSSATGVEYYLEGRTEDGFRAAGNFALMRPPRLPTRADHLPVDALQTARILRARQVLGQAYVTDEDIWRLEREGKMKDLEVPARGAEGDPGLLPRKN